MDNQDDAHFRNVDTNNQDYDEPDDNREMLLPGTAVAPRAGPTPSTVLLKEPKPKGAPRKVAGAGSGGAAKASQRPPTKKQKIAGGGAGAGAANATEAGTGAGGAGPAEMDDYDVGEDGKKGSKKRFRGAFIRDCECSRNSHPSTSKTLF